MNTSRQTLTTLALLVGAFAALGSPASAARPPREFRSAAGDLLLRIDRGKPPATECRADLARVEGERAKLWSRSLVNEVAPDMAFIRADAKFVITLDEYRRGGARNALVIYGARGELLRHWTLSDLLVDADWPHVKVERKSLVWLEDAEFAFVQPDRFEISLSWNRKIIVDLARVALIDQPAAASNGPPPEIAALLWPASAAGNDKSPAVDDAAEESTAETDELAMAEVEEEVPSLVDILSDIAQGDNPTDTNPTADATAESANTAESQTTDTTATDAGAVVVPQPDPAHPVDYIAWANQFTQSDPNAIAIMDAAMDGIIEFTGDGPLYERAQAGDPAAVTDPQIVAWLDSNRDALKNFRDWTLYDYHGRQMQSSDGMMIGVLLPALGKLRNLARISAIDARRLAATGDPNAAVDTLLDNLRAGKHAGQGVTLIENLVGHAIQSHSSDTLLDIVADPASEAKIDYADLAARLEYSYELPPPARQVIQFERAMALDTMQHAFEPGLDGAPPKPRWDKLNMILSMTGGESNDVMTMIKAAGADYGETVSGINRFYDAAGAAFQNPYPNAVTELKSLESSIQAGAGANPLLGALAPALTRVAEVTTSSESRRRATLLVTNLMAFKQANGVFPESLEAFGDRPFARDPFTEAPFRYERTADGSFRLYSAGADQTDNGGLHDDKKTDLVFWPRPPKKK
ncbi:MAG: hypothetical protein SF069_16900 [Phycisphaerae bacterium]|nr:hypothetical protein [Phycisphaerae bacterium]